VRDKANDLPLETIVQIPQEPAAFSDGWLIVTGRALKLPGKSCRGARPNLPCPLSHGLAFCRRSPCIPDGSPAFWRWHRDCTLFRAPAHSCGWHEL